MDEYEANIIEFLYGADSFLFKKVDEVTNSEIETFIMACWRCFMTNSQWLLLFYKNNELVPYWQIAFTTRLLMETVADLKYILNSPEKIDTALRAYKNSTRLTNKEFIEEIQKLHNRNKKERQGSLLYCNLEGGGNIERIRKMLGDKYADSYIILCDFNHCNYCGISIAASPTENLTELRQESIKITFELCDIMRNVLSRYKKFSKLPDWLGKLSEHMAKNNKSAGKEQDGN